MSVMSLSCVCSGVCHESVMCLFKGSVMSLSCVCHESVQVCHEPLQGSVVSVQVCHVSVHGVCHESVMSVQGSVMSNLKGCLNPVLQCSRICSGKSNS